MADVKRGGPLLVNGEALRVEVTAPRAGGGEKFNPQTSDEARALLAPLIQSAVDAAARLPMELRGERLYVEARLLPNYIAASHFPADLLAAIGAVPVGSRADRALYRTRTKEPKLVGTKRLILSIEDSGLEALSDLIERGGANKEQRQAIEGDAMKLDDFTLSSAPAFRTPDGSGLWEAVLHPEPVASWQTTPASDEVLGKWEHWIALLGGELNTKYIRRVGNLTFTAVELPIGAVEEAARFNPLRVIRPMPVIRPVPGVQLRSGNPFTAPASRGSRSGYTRIAVFDGGLGVPTSLFPEACIDLTPEPADPSGNLHGTAVTGAVMYGLAQPGEQAEELPLPVDSFRIYPAPDDPTDPDGYWMLDRIVETVEAGGHKIVNLSLGPSAAVEEDQEPNLWTSTLDQLAWENDVVFVVAAGNHGEADPKLGLNRVEAPADMANGVSVGAADKLSPQPKWSRTPYSSIGPGRQGSRIQPICVQFGGTQGDQFPILKSDGSFGRSLGTSFATPLVTHALAEVASQLPRPTPSALRAFVTHFAERHSQHKKRRDEVGYGRVPLSFDPTLASSSNEAHVLYVDEIARDELLGYQVPVPARFRGRVQVRVTLAFMSPVEPTEPTEYTRSTIDVTFRPNENRYVFHPPKGSPGAIKDVVLDHTSAEAIDLLEKGWTQASAPKAEGLGPAAFIPEHNLRDEGKWETLRHARMNLASGAADNPRIELSYVARQLGALEHGPAELPFAVLISVIDQDATGTLYPAVVDQFAALRPLIDLRAQAQVRSR